MTTEPKMLTIVTVTHNITQNWRNYLQHIRRLTQIYGPKFKVQILDNSEPQTYKLKAQEVRDLGLQNVSIHYVPTFIECRNSMANFVDTEYMTILDDDDYLTDAFLSIFNWLLKVYPEVDYFNLNKVKIGDLQDYPQGETKALPFSIREAGFYNYDNYLNEKYVMVYPINGYCLLKTSLYRRVGKTFTGIADDCYAMMRCYLEADFAVKVPIVWQFYYAQNHHLLGRWKLEETEQSLYTQMEALIKEYTGTGSKERIFMSVLNKQIYNLIRSLETQPLQGGGSYQAQTLKKLYDRTKLMDCQRPKFASVSGKRN